MTHLRDVADRLNIQVDPLVLHMNEWEVHALRNTVAAMLVTVQLYARSHPDAKDLAEELVNMKRKLADDQLDEFQRIVVKDVLG